MTWKGLSSRAFDGKELREDVDWLAVVAVLVGQDSVLRRCLLEVVMGQWGESHSPGLRLHHCRNRIV